jgi:Domain of unknown function (DUF4157)/DNA/RNA non-specific endonuclease
MMAQALQPAIASAPLARARAAPESVSRQPGVARVPGMPAYLQKAGLTGSSPNDAAEREAVTVARAVASMAAPPMTRASASGIQRSALGMGQAARTSAPNPALRLGGGRPLPRALRRYMEPRFGADFGGVRIYTDDRAALLNRQLNARAFATGGAIAFGQGQFQPDTPAGRELIAHELTHTIQQGAAIQRSALPLIHQAAANGLQRESDSSLSFDPRDYFAKQAKNIPGFRMLTLVIGVNPVNGSKVKVTTAEMLRAFVELMPGGGLITQALDRYEIFDKAGSWIDGQVAALGLSVSIFKKEIDRLVDLVDWVHPIDSAERLWEEAKRFLNDSYERIKALAKRIADAVLTFIRDAVLNPLSALARKSQGWDLLCAVLGKNPITGAKVPPTAENLVGGFMTLIQQQEVWQRIQENKAIDKVFAWFQGAWSTVKGFVAQIPELALAAIRKLVIEDLLDIPGAIKKVAGVFGSFINDFVQWGGKAVWTLLEIVVKVVKPEAWAYIQRTGSALRSILRNPLPFVGNLVKAAKLGLSTFAGRFGNHLKAALIDWLTGSLPGIYIPAALTLQEIAKFVMSALGLTWANIRIKLVAAIGETAVGVLEKTFGIVVTLVRDGPAAAWEQIKEQMTNLKEMAIGAIQGFVIDMVVQKAIPRLVAMFIPGLGFVSALASIYGTVQTLIAKIGQIAQAVTAFIDSIVAIAAGNIGAAAGKVEQALAGALKIAIGLLAGFAGMGNVSQKIMEILQKIRAPIDKAIDWLVGWIAKAGKAVVSKAKQGAAAVLGWLKKFLKPRPFNAGPESHTTWITEDGTVMVASDPKTGHSTLATLKTRAEALPKKAYTAKLQKTVGIPGAKLKTVEKLTKAPPPSAGANDNEPTAMEKSWSEFIVALGDAYGGVVIAESGTKAVIDHSKGQNTNKIIFDPTTGRPISAQATLKQDSGGHERKDNATEVGKLSKTGTDDGGHLIGHRFMGDTVDEGIIPQHFNLNRGPWKKMENEWAGWIKQGCNVKPKVSIFPPGAIRPTYLVVSYTVHDRKKNDAEIHKKTHQFKNEGGEKFDRLSSDAITEKKANSP